MLALQNILPSFACGIELIFRLAYLRDLHDLRVRHGLHALCGFCALRGSLCGKCGRKYSADAMPPISLRAYGLPARFREFALRVCFKCAAGVVCQALSRRNICRRNFTSQTFRIASANFAFGQGWKLRRRTNCSGRPRANINCAKTNDRIATARARRVALP